jgi:Raf kinase inhibitor-like YbhB/YbcL family protein
MSQKILLMLLITSLLTATAAMIVVNAAKLYHAFSTYRTTKSLKSTQKSTPTIFIPNAQVVNLSLTSPAFAPNQPIPSKYTCDGDNINPPLTIANVASPAASLSLIVTDLDAPAGEWVHWLVWNLPPDTNSIQAGSLPEEAKQGTTSFQKTGYNGPCPPSNTHRYHFELYALDTYLDLEESTTKEVLLQVLAGHQLAQTELVGTYAR